MVSYAEADEVGLDVVGGKREGSKQIVGEVVTRCYFLVEQEGAFGDGGVVADADVEHETHAVEHHFVGDKASYLQEVKEPVPVGMQCLG